MSAGSSGLTNSSLEHFVTTVSHRATISDYSDWTIIYAVSRFNTMHFNSLRDIGPKPIRRRKFSGTSRIFA